MQNIKSKPFLLKNALLNKTFLILILKNVPQDTQTQTKMSTAVYRVGIHHTELCVGVSVTVPRGTVTTSTDVP